MNIIVNDVNFRAEEHLLEYARKKTEKLYQLYDGIVGVEVSLRLENNSEELNKTAEIRVTVPGNELFAKKTLKTFEEAADASIMALKKQLTKHKEKAQ